MQQNTLPTSPKKTRKRIGRGNGSGQGTYSGRGMKGQSARSGGKRRPGFEGGQTPLIRKMPKMKGFKHPHAQRKANQVINLRDLEQNFDNGEVTKAELKAKGLIASVNRPVKLLAQGELSKKLTVSVDFASEKAAEAVKKAGGTVTTTAKVEAEPKKKEEAAEEKAEA